MFSISPDSTPIGDVDQMKRTYNRARWSVFVSATLGYGLYYVCRLSLNVIKKPIVDAGVLTETELGVMGSALFITYAVGKFANGFLADRSNVRMMLGFGMLISALINLMLGYTNTFYFFVALWAVNGWVQSMGEAPCFVVLSRCFTEKERGTFYGLWSSSHNIGEALTFVATALIVSTMGWQWGFKGAGIIGLIGFIFIIVFMRDTPGSCGLPSINEFKSEKLSTRIGNNVVDKKDVARAQKEVLRNPAIWMLALSSAFMYISRYAVNSWGIFYLEAEKGYTNLEASSVISISSICGILGTISCGFISDKFFNGRRNMRAFLFGKMNVLSLALVLIGPRHAFWIDVSTMDMFGLAKGVLICL